MSYIYLDMEIGSKRFHFALLAAVTIVCAWGAVGGAEKSVWRKVESGLEIAQFSTVAKSPAADSALTIVRVDPDRWQFKLISRSLSEEKENLTAKAWCEKYGLVAAINAGMFQQDYLTHVGYMNVEGKIASRRVKSYQSAVAFGAKRDGIPSFRIFDLDKDSLNAIVRDYNNVCQNMRLISRPGENRWSQQDRRWTEVAICEDSAGNALFIFCERALSMHDFNKLLLSLPIGVVAAQHLEGGLEAQLYVKSGKTEIEKLGSYAPTPEESYYSGIAYPIPNVIGIVRKK